MGAASRERWSAVGGVAFVASYLVAFSLGIEVGPTDREILDYYADAGHRTREAVAFFLIAQPIIAGVIATGPDCDDFDARLADHTLNILFNGLLARGCDDAAQGPE